MTLKICVKNNLYRINKKLINMIYFSLLEKQKKLMLIFESKMERNNLMKGFTA